MFASRGFNIVGYGASSCRKDQVSNASDRGARGLVKIVAAMASVGLAVAGYSPRAPEMPMMARKTVGPDSIIDFRLDEQHHIIDLFASIQNIKIGDFQEKARLGEFNTDMIVFNNLVKNKGEFISNWETTVNKSWHINLF